MFGRAKRHDDATIEALNRRLNQMEENLSSLKRQFALLDASFEDLLDKALRKWDRTRMQIRREAEDDMPKKPRRRNDILSSAVDKVLER